MKIPAIKKLVESHEIHQLIKAEADLIDEITPDVEIEGSDEGEKLTHVMAAIWIKEEMNKSNYDFNTALRSYTSRVRQSIS